MNNIEGRSASLKSAYRGEMPAPAPSGHLPMSEPSPKSGEQREEMQTRREANQKEKDRKKKMKDRKKKISPLIQKKPARQSRFFIKEPHD